MCQTLRPRIDNAIETYLGLDKKKQLREATAQVEALQKPALHFLSFLKTQVEVDFGAGSGEILKTLGYETNLRNAQKGDQEALIQLLYAFKKGMTDELKIQITGKGTSPDLIDQIINYADQLAAANMAQESLKETSKSLSAEAINALNDIFNEVMGICKIAAGYYNDDSLKKAQFTFSKVVANMNVTKAAVQSNAG